MLIHNKYYTEFKTNNKFDPEYLDHYSKIKKLENIHINNQILEMIKNTKYKNYEEHLHILKLINHLNILIVNFKKTKNKIQVKVILAYQQKIKQMLSETEFPDKVENHKYLNILNKIKPLNKKIKTKPKNTQIHDLHIVPNNGQGLCLFYTIQQVLDLVFNQKVDIKTLKQYILPELLLNWTKSKNALTNNMKLSPEYNKYIIQDKHILKVKTKDDFKKYILSNAYLGDDDTYKLYSQKYNFGYIIFNKGIYLYNFPPKSSIFVIFLYRPGHWQLMVRDKQKCFRYKHLKEDLGNVMLNLLNKSSQIYGVSGLDELIQTNI